MQLHTLIPRTKMKKRPAVGRGGKRGKTSGRGGKGQTARAGHKIRPEARDLIKKLPKRRGWGRNRSRTVRRARARHAPVNLAALEAAFAAGAIVSPASLREQKLVRGRASLIKILGTGALSKSLSVKGCAVSVSARRAIERAGGSVA